MKALTTILFILSFACITSGQHKVANEKYRFNIEFPAEYKKNGSYGFNCVLENTRYSIEPEKMNFDDAVSYFYRFNSTAYAEYYTLNDYQVFYMRGEVKHIPGQSIKPGKLIIISKKGFRMSYVLSIMTKGYESPQAVTEKFVNSFKTYDGFSILLKGNDLVSTETNQKLIAVSYQSPITPSITLTISNTNQNVNNTSPNQNICSVCFGNGYTTCPRCAGKGKDPYGEVCFHCKGGGKRLCTFCNAYKTPDVNGMIICTTCQGSGWTQCAGCSSSRKGIGGNGEVCRICNGMGRNICPICAGIGKVKAK